MSLLKALYNTFDKKKVIAFIYGFQIFIWLLFAGGQEWFWRPIPYITSVLVLILTYITFHKHLWRIDLFQKIIFVGLLVYLVNLFISQFLLTELQYNEYIKIRKSLFTYIDQAMLSLAVVMLLFGSSVIIKYTEKGRFLVIVGLSIGTIVYSILRFYSHSINIVQFVSEELIIGFKNENAFGHVLNIVLISNFVVLLTKTNSKINITEKIVAFILLSVVAFFVYINGSRGAFVSLFIAVLAIMYLFLLRRKTIKRKFLDVLVFITSIIILYVSAVFAPDIVSKYFSVSDLDNPLFRLEIWSETLRQLSQMPFTGVGLTCFKYLFNSGNLKLSESIFTHAESSFLTIAYEQGIFAMVLTILCLLMYFWLSFNQRNRSWRTSCIGVGVLTLVFTHNIYDTHLRFAAISVLLAIMLGMLNGHKALNQRIKKIRNSYAVGYVITFFCGVVFVWAVLLLKLSITINSLIDNIYYLDVKKIMPILRKYEMLSIDEFDRYNYICLHVREKIRNRDLIIPTTEETEKLHSMVAVALKRQPAEPQALQTYGFCLLLKDEQTFFDNNNKVNTLSDQLIYYLMVNLKLRSNKNFELNTTNTETTKQVNGRNISCLIKPVSPSSLNAYVDLQETIELEIFLKPELTKIVTHLNDIIKLRHFNKIHNNQEQKAKFIEKINFPTNNTFFHDYKTLLNLSQNKAEKNNLLKSTEEDVTKYFSKSIYIYPGFYPLYCDALILLGRYRPEALSAFYNSLDDQQKETFWKARERFLVYEPRLRLTSILKWIATSAPDVQERLKAIEQLSNIDKKTKQHILYEIYFDKDVDLNTRLRAEALLSKIAETSVLISNFPQDLEKNFYASARRYLVAVRENHPLRNEFREKIKLPENLSEKFIIVETANTLLSEGYTELARNLLRHALELDEEILSLAKIRNTEATKRRNELGLEADNYLIRLSIIAKSKDATANDVLDFLNQTVFLNREILSSEFIKTFKPNEWSKKDILEYLYYKAKIERSTRNDEEMATLIDFLSK